MSEYQDIQAVKEYGTSEWSYVGQDEECGRLKVYQTNSGELFAIDPDSETAISFEVYEDEGIFTVY